MDHISPARADLVRRVVLAWACTVAVAVLYVVWLGRLRPSRDDLDFVTWACFVAIVPSVVAVLLVRRPWFLLLALVAAPMAGFLVAYCTALVTYGSGAEDGTVWRGYGGATLGLVAAAAGWIVTRLGAPAT